MNKRFPNWAGWGAIAAWGSASLIIVETGGIPPLLLNAISCLIGFFLGLIYWLVTEQSIKTKFQLSGRAYALGLGGICVYMALYYSGLKMAPPFEANALNYMWPLLLVFLNAKIDKTKLSTNQMIGILGGFAGSTLIFVKYGIDKVSFGHVIGLVCAFSGAVVWAVYSSLTRYVEFPSDSIGIFLLISAPVSYGLHRLFESATGVAWEKINWVAVALVGFINIAFVLWDFAMKKGDRQMLSASAYLIPAVSVILVGLGTHSGIPRTTLIGVAVIVLSCIIVNWQSLKPLLKPTSRS